MALWNFCLKKFFSWPICEPGITQIPNLCSVRSHRSPVVSYGDLKLHGILPGNRQKLLLLDYESRFFFILRGLSGIYKNVKKFQIKNWKFNTVYMKPWFRSMVFHTKLKVITRNRLFLGSESRWNHDEMLKTLCLARDFVRVGEIPHAKNFKPP